MVELKKILVATDGSEYSRRAVKIAIELARKFNSEVEMLFVIRMPQEYDTNVYNYQILLDQIEEEGERTIVATLEGTDLTGVVLKSKKLHGNPGNVIIQEVENENIDLVVMGSHGYGVFVGSVLGSVSQKVLHGAKCPVLIVK